MSDAAAATFAGSTVSIPFRRSTNAVANFNENGTALVNSNYSTALRRMMTSQYLARTAGLLVVLALASNCGRAIAADLTFNISYIAESDPLPGTRVYGDVWAENGFVYVGTDVNNGGMHIFSISNSGVPTFLHRYDGDQLEDVEVRDGIGFFGSDVTTSSSGTGVDIVDLAIPFDPIFLSRVDGSTCISPGVCAHNKVHTLSVAQAPDGNSYLYTTDNATDVIKITRVFDPESLDDNPNTNPVVAPLLVKSLDLGIGPVGGTNIAAHEVVVLNDRMYVASKDNAFTTCCGVTSIYDVSEPANPVLLKNFDSGPRSHTAMPSADGNTLIVTEERPNGNVHIYDISNPSNPILRSTINRTTVGIDAHSPHHPHVHGKLLFLTWYEAGLQVFSIADPANPIHIGAFDTYPGTSTSYNGNWGVDLSMGLKRVLLSDRSRGLIVVDASNVILPGDYDQNTVVDAADYAAWRAAFGQDGGLDYHNGPIADGNFDNVVDAADYVIWRSNVGQIGTSNTSSPWFTIITYVPEPATVHLLGLCIYLVCSCRFTRNVLRRRASSLG